MFNSKVTTAGASCVFFGMTRLFWLLVAVTLISPVPARSADGVYLMPMNCTELLPDHSLFIGFMEAVAKGQVTADRALSKRLFRILALREKMVDAAAKYRDSNPVDLLIRKTECFYREQKEPLAQVPFNDSQFLAFLRSNLKELETKIDDAILDWQIEQEQRGKYEAQLQKNQSLVESLRKEADREAKVAFEKLSSNAKRKVQVP